jgi:hypothetical protein
VSFSAPGSSRTSEEGELLEGLTRDRVNSPSTKNNADVIAVTVAPDMGSIVAHAERIAPAAATSIAGSFSNTDFSEYLLAMDISLCVRRRIRCHLHCRTLAALGKCMTLVWSCCL